MTDDRQPAVIIGGGISGIVCALELNRLDIPVTLVEKEASLGGLAARFCCKAAEACNKCFACVADKRIRELSERTGIARFLSTELKRVTGMPGNYRLELASGGRTREVPAAAVVLAAGIEPYDAAGKGEYGYGLCKNVITGRELEEMLRTRGGLTRPSDETVPRTVAFIQCVGSRDESIGNLYCSQVCCAYALRLIRTLRHNYPEIAATFLYMDIQPAGASFHRFLSACREDKGIRFIRTIPSKISCSPVTHDLRVRLADPGSGEIGEAPFDLVVLSVGVVLSHGTRHLAELLGVGVDQDGFLINPPDQKGIFVTGACTGPKDIDRSITQARATAGAVHTYLQGRKRHAADGL